MSLNQSQEKVTSSGRGGQANVEWGGEEDSEPSQQAEKKLSKRQKDAAKKAAKKGQGKVVSVADPVPPKATELVEEEPAGPSAASHEASSASAAGTTAASQSQVQPITTEEAEVIAQPTPESPFSQGVQVLPVPESVKATHLIDNVVDSSGSFSTGTSNPSAASPSSSSVPQPSRSPPPSSQVRYIESPPLTKNPSFLAFRSSVQKHRCVVGTKTWIYYDLGPKDQQPLICIPGTSGTAESFFFQLLQLGNKGFRVISVSPPAYLTHDEWCNGFNGFLYAMNLTGEPKPNSPGGAPASPVAPSKSADGASPATTGKVHVFANSLAGYLMLYYISHIIPTRNFVSSLIICNSFNSTEHYQAQSSGWCIALLKRAPNFLVKKYVLDSMPETTLYPEAVDFMIEMMEEFLPTDVLASRLILNILKNRGISNPELWKQGSLGGKFDQSNITILDTTDESVIPEKMRQKLYDSLPDARYALLKHGGDMPFLSVPDEVNMHLQVHLRLHGVFPSLHTSPKGEKSADVEIPFSSTTKRSQNGDEQNGGSDEEASSSSFNGMSKSSKPNTNNNSASTSLATTGPLHFLQPSLTHAQLGKTKVAGLGYGYDDDQDNDSIFLTKPSASPPATGLAAGAPGQVSLATKNYRRSDDLEERERSEILKSVLDEVASPSSTTSSTSFAAEKERERKDRESRLAAEQARIQQELKKDARQEEVMSTLLDDQAIEDEFALTTKKKPVKKVDPEDLF